MQVDQQALDELSLIMVPKNIQPSEKLIIEVSAGMLHSDEIFFEQTT